MQQPINGRLLIRVASSKYKHVTTASSKQHENANSVGEVISVAPDADDAVRELYFKGKVANFVKPSELVGKTVRWPKYAEQDTLIDGLNENDPSQQYALLKYEDIISYEN